MSNELAYVPGNSIFTITSQDGGTRDSWDVTISNSVPSCGLIYFLYEGAVYICAWGVIGGGANMMFHDILKTDGNLSVQTISQFQLRFTFSYALRMNITIKNLAFMTGPPYTARPTRSNFKNGYTVFGLQDPYSDRVLYIPTNPNTSGWILGVSVSVDNNSKYLYFVVNFNNEGGSISNYHFISSYNVSGSSNGGNISVTSPTFTSVPEWAICFVSSGFQ